MTRDATHTHVQTMHVGLRSLHVKIMENLMLREHTEFLSLYNMRSKSIMLDFIINVHVINTTKCQRTKRAPLTDIRTGKHTRRSERFLISSTLSSFEGITVTQGHYGDISPNDFHKRLSRTFHQTGEGLH